MRVLLIVNLLILLIGISYSFRITDFLDNFVDERQDGDVSDQILPVFVIAFFASLVNSLLTMNMMSTSTGILIRREISKENGNLEVNQ